MQGEAEGIALSLQKTLPLLCVCVQRDRDVAQYSVCMLRDTQACGVLRL